MEESFIQYSEGEKYFTLKSYYIFKHKMEQVWNIISHPGKLLIALGEWVDNIGYKEEDNQIELLLHIPMKFKKGSKLSFKWKSIFECRLEVKDIVDNDFKKRILFDSYSLYPFEIKYQIIYNLYWNSVEENTLLIHEVVCEVNNDLFQNDQEQNKRERFIMFKKIEEMLNNDISSLYQEEGVILDINIDELWNIVTDWRKFREYVPQICLDISYNGDPRKIGTEMRIINKGKDKNGFTNLRVIESFDNNKHKKRKLNKYNETLNNNDIETNINERCMNSSKIKKKNLNKYKENKRELSERLFNNTENINYDEPRIENRNSFKSLNQSKDSDNSNNPDCLVFQEGNDQDSDRSKLKNNGAENLIHEYRYVLECYEGVPKCPLQLLIFKFLKLSEDKSLLVFRHEFKQPVKQLLIRNIGVEKKKILIDFKNSINLQKQNI